MVAKKKTKSKVNEAGNYTKPEMRKRQFVSKGLQGSGWGLQVMAQPQKHQLRFQKKKIENQAAAIERQRKAIEKMIEQQQDKGHNQ